MLWLFPAASQAQLMSHKLMSYVVEKNMPSILYADKDSPWEYGTYSLKVTKRAGLSVSSTAVQLEINAPVAIKMLARVRKNIMGFAVAFDCSTGFNTTAIIALHPQLNKPVVRAPSHLDVVIPAVQLNCGSFSLPVQAFLQQFVDSHKNEWKVAIEREIKKTLAVQ